MCDYVFGQVVCYYLGSVCLCDYLGYFVCDYLGVRFLGLCTCDYLVGMYVIIWLLCVIMYVRAYVGFFVCGCFVSD